MGRKINTKLTKDFILSKVDQISIFSVYFNLPIQTIQYCIDTGEFIHSPIRVDIHPTCGFKYDKDNFLLDVEHFMGIMKNLEKEEEKP